MLGKIIIKRAGFSVSVWRLLTDQQDSWIFLPADNKFTWVVSGNTNIYAKKGMNNKLY